MASWRDLDAFVLAHGLPVGTVRPGLTKPTLNTGHTSNSLHYKGRARDYGEGLANPWVAMAHIALLFEPLAKGDGYLIEELFYAPTSSWWDNGRWLVVGGHTNHVHVGIRAGVTLPMPKREDDMGLVTWEIHPGQKKNFKIPPPGGGGSGGGYGPRIYCSFNTDNYGNEKLLKGRVAFLNAHGQWVPGGLPGLAGSMDTVEFRTGTSLFGAGPGVDSVTVENHDPPGGRILTFTYEWSRPGTD